MEGPTLRERRRLSTRRDISRAALYLVLEHGLGNVTVDDIAEAAGISPRTFFNYFPSKKSAVLAGPDPLPDEAVEVFVTDLDTPVPEGLRRLLDSLDVASAEQRELMSRMQQVITAHPELVPVLHERVMEFEGLLAGVVARRLGTEPGDPRPTVAAAVCTALVRVAMTGALDDGVEPERPDEHGGPLHLSLDRAFAALRELFTT